MTYDFEHVLPALCVLFGRSAIASYPERIFENDMLMEAIRNARITLDLEPWGDPIEDYLDWALQKNESDIEQTERDKETEILKAQAHDAQKTALQKTNELRGKEQEIDRLLEKLEKVEKQLPDKEETTVKDSTKQAELEESLQHIRQHVKNLKEEISIQQQSRAQLRKQLRDAEKKSLSAKPVQEESNSIPDEGIPVEYEDAPKKILIPEYTDAFRKRCESMPPAIVAKALRSVAGFTAYDKSIWRQAKQIETMDAIYRIRIGLQYRLLMRWQPGTKLEVLDLIPRQSLETWIKQHQV